MSVIIIKNILEEYKHVGYATVGMETARAN